MIICKLTPNTGASDPSFKGAREVELIDYSSVNTHLGNHG